MKVRQMFIPCLVGLCLLFLVWSIAVHGEGLRIIPEEPQTLADLVEISYTIDAGLLIFHYDLDHDKEGHAEFRIGRIPNERLVSEFGEFYVYRLRPVYYAVDFDLNGDFTDDEIFVDMADHGERDLLSYPQWLKVQE